MTDKATREQEPPLDICPKCGGKTEQGYGFDGRGGVYVYCPAAGCDYCAKMQE